MTTQSVHIIRQPAPANDWCHFALNDWLRFSVGQWTGFTIDQVRQLLVVAQTTHTPPGGHP